MRRNQEIAWTVVLGSVAILVGFTVWAVGKKADKEPRCYETTADISHVTPIIQGPRTHSGLYACGLYSRPALPDVIRCYELKDGCAE